jgi:hypothetical protein
MRGLYRGPVVSASKWQKGPDFRLTLSPLVLLGKRVKYPWTGGVFFKAAGRWP